LAHDRPLGSLNEGIEGAAAPTVVGVYQRRQKTSAKNRWGAGNAKRNSAGFAIRMNGIPLYSGSGGEADAPRREETPPRNLDAHPAADPGPAPDGSLPRDAGGGPRRRRGLRQG